MFTGLQEILSGTFHLSDYPLSGYNSSNVPQQYSTIYLGTTGDSYDIYLPTISGSRIVAVPDYKVSTAMELCDSLGYQLISYSQNINSITGKYFNDTSWETAYSPGMNTITCADYATGDIVFVSDNTQVYQALDSINYLLFRFFFLWLVFTLFKLFLDFTISNKGNVK